MKGKGRAEERGREGERKKGGLARKGKVGEEDVTKSGGSRGWGP